MTARSAPPPSSHVEALRPIRAIAGTGAALLLLWGASFALSYVDAGPFALALALGIAVVKAAVVMVVFMEFWRSSMSVKLAFFAAIALLAALIGLMIADVETRDPEPDVAPRRAAQSG